jgi:hypothetical protein
MTLSPPGLTRWAVAKKFFLFFLLFSLFAACRGGPAGRVANTDEIAEPGQPLLLSLPAGSGLVFIGISGRRSNPKETIELALEDAARRVAIFHGVSGEFAIENKIGSGAFDYINNVYTSLAYDEEGYKRYVEALHYDEDGDSLKTENALILRTSFQSALPEPVSYFPVYSGKNRKPEWVDNPPLQIGSYEVGIGFAGRHSSLADTFIVSYNNAIFSIIRNINALYRSQGVNYQGPGAFDYKTADENIVYASASLNYFYVLDTWIDPKNKSVWTLAIAKKTE